MLYSPGEDFERNNVVLGDCVSCQLGMRDLLMETQQPGPEVHNNGILEDSCLVGRARAVGVVYEFAKPGVDETEDDRRKRQRRNQRRVTAEERRLREVVGDLPPPPPAGSSQIEDNAYSAIRAFEVEQMTYQFGCCEVCNERRLEWKGTGNVALAAGKIRRYQKFGQMRTTWTQCLFLKNCLECQMQSRC